MSTAAAWMSLALLLTMGSSTAWAASTVTVSAPEGSVASEIGPTPGFFVFTREGDLSQPLTVNYTLGGTATRGSDYLVWETRATFEPGATTSLVTVLPRNDALQEGNESIVLTLVQGPDFTVGTADSASIPVADAFFQNFPGVIDSPELDPRTGLTRVSPDLRYLDARVDPGSGSLVIQVGVDVTMFFNNVVIYLDTDQNPATGDYRAGHVAGQEYRLDAAAGLISDYRLSRLRTVPPVDPSEAERDPVIRIQGASTNNGILTLVVPLSDIGNPAAVDVFAISHIGSAALTGQGVGDRAPDYGALDTRSQQVVVRRPGVTQYVRLSDPPGDNVNGFDLLFADFSTVADQFFITLGFSRPFDPSRPTQFPGPSGTVLLDSDRRLLTGGLFLGDDIPTWGGDVRLFYEMGSFQAPMVLVQPDNLGNTLAFGQDKNDGRWLVQGGVFFLGGSLSIFDPLLKLYDSAGGLRTIRIPGDGRMHVHTFTLGSNIGRDIADTLPDGKNMADTVSARVLRPFSWDPNNAPVPDPVEFPQPISGQDLTGIRTQLIEGNLVIQGILSAWSNTDIGNLFQVFMDTDHDTGTAPHGVVSNGPGAPIGVDYELRLVSDTTGTAPVYYAQLLFADGTRTRNDALILPQPTFSLAQPGSFTVTLPLAAIGNPSRLRLYVATSVYPAPGLLDLAPPQPLEILIPGQ
ncbi:Calx-beta domain-containing protein [Archangium lipolyticum]|uniref:Calx-beta domain-containing protein n=1 Tax=Archangium lipolyticum TaxID=2970465 RepID=UPI00214A532E|nr:Calx-beta domain-containing protein [Archangium lipolyticum]